MMVAVGFNSTVRDPLNVRAQEMIGPAAEVLAGLGLRADALVNAKFVAHGFHGLGGETEASAEFLPGADFGAFLSM